MLSILMTKQGAIGLGIIVVLMAGAAWLNGQIQAAKAEGEAKEIARVAELNYQAMVDSIESAWAEREAAWDSTREALTADLEAKSTAARVARNGALQAVSDAQLVISALSDSLEGITQADLDVIAAGIDSLEEAERLCNGALETCQELVKAADTRIFDLEAQQRQSLDVARQQNIVIDRLRELRRPRMTASGYLGWGIAGLATVLHFVR